MYITVHIYLPIYGFINSAEDRNSAERDLAECVDFPLSSLSPARGDLVHSGSHNFIRPDHGPLGTL